MKKILRTIFTILTVFSVYTAIMTVIGITIVFVRHIRIMKPEYYFFAFLIITAAAVLFVIWRKTKPSDKK